MSKSCVMKKTTELVIAKEEKQCVICGGTIPKGHKYWQNNYEPFGAEHTNCMDYSSVKTDIRRKPISYDTVR